MSTGTRQRASVRGEKWHGEGSGSQGGFGLCHIDGLGGPDGFVPAHRAQLGRLLLCRAGATRHAEVEAQPGITNGPGWHKHEGLRPGPCSCRLRIEPCSCRANLLYFGPAHGPRAIWPSIIPTSIHAALHRAPGALRRGHMAGKLKRKGSPCVTVFCHNAFMGDNSGRCQINLAGIIHAKCFDGDSISVETGATTPDAIFLTDHNEQINIHISLLLTK